MVGDFTPTRLSDIQLKMEEMWAEPQNQKTYAARGETVKAIVENQTATFEALEDKEKKKSVTVNWIDFCSTAATETQEADQCPMDAACPEGETVSKNYALDIFLETCYSVNEDKLEDNIFSPEDVIAVGLLKAQKDLLELFNKKAIAVLVANMGVNPYDGEPGTYNAATGFTDIESEDFTIEKLYPYFAMVMALNGSTDTFLIDGGNMFQQALLAMKMNANDNGKLDLGLFEMLPFYQDLFGFAATGNSLNTFMIDKGSVAIATRSRYPTEPREIGGGVNQTRYSIPLEQLPGVNIDVAYQPVCDGDTIKHKWNLKLRAGVFVNPTICDEDNTGILGFKKIPNIVI